MKIAIGILLLTALIAVLGMFYWMYKAKSGELNLSTNSWHYKLKHWMWDFETYQGNNACPYYWGLVFSVLLLPFYCIVKYSVLLGFYIKNKLPSFSKPKVFSKLSIPNIIPPTKKEMYSKVYKNSKKWLLYILIAISTIAVLSLFIKGFMVDWKAMVIIFSIFIVVFLHILLYENSEVFNEYYSKHLINIFNGIVGLLKLPFLLAYELIRIPIQYIFKVYTNNCPPITWTTEQ